MCIYGEKELLFKEAAITTTRGTTFWAYWDLLNEVPSKKFYLVAQLRNGH